MDIIQAEQSDDLADLQVIARQAEQLQAAARLAGIDLEIVIRPLTTEAA